MSVTSSKGLSNQPGENNCFLNCAVQALWHVDVFRESLRLVSGHRCTGVACIFCALKVTFTQLSYSGQQTLLPNILRKALAESFSAEQRFQLGDMDDAAECLDTILQRLHLHLCAPEEGTGICEAQHCISHSKFGMRLLELPTCPNCKMRTSGERYMQLIHYVATDALVSQVRSIQSGSETPGDDGDPTSAFSHLLRRAANAGDLRDCLSCNNPTARLNRHLLSPSSVLILGLVWHSQQPGVSFLADVVESIGTELQPDLLFDRQPGTTRRQSNSEPLRLQLTALICYYGRHYSAFCRQQSGVWLFFDDDLVRPIGPNWRAVVHRCVRGGFQPLLLLYTDPSAAPIDTGGSLPVTVRVPLDQFRRESALCSAMSTSSGSLGRSRTCLAVGADPAGSEPPNDREETTATAAGDTLASQHSRSSSLSEDTLLAGGNPHPHRRGIAVATPPPPPQFANDNEPPTVEKSINGPPSFQEFRRQGSYISAVTERPSARPGVKRTDSLDSSPPISPTTRASPGSSPIHRSLSCNTAPPSDGQKYIERQTVETILQLQRQQAAHRRRVSPVEVKNTTPPSSATAANNVSFFGTIPRRRTNAQPLPSAVTASQQLPNNAAAPQQLPHATTAPQQLPNTTMAPQQLPNSPKRTAPQKPRGPPPPPPIQRKPMRALHVDLNDDQSHGRAWQFQKVNHELHQVLRQQNSVPSVPVQQQRPTNAHQQLQMYPDVHQRQQIVPGVQTSFPSYPHPHSDPMSPRLHLLPNKHSPSVSQSVEISASQQDKNTTKRPIEGACPKCGVADSWTIDAGICIRCNIKIPSKSAPPLKPALISTTGRSASISSADSSNAPSLSETESSITGDGSRRPRKKKKSVTFDEATIVPTAQTVRRERPVFSDGVEPCQLCQQRSVDPGGPAYCSVCQVYLSRFVSQAR